MSSADTSWPVEHRRRHGARREPPHGSLPAENEVAARDGLQERTLAAPGPVIGMASPVNLRGDGNCRECPAANVYSLGGSTSRICANVWAARGAPGHLCGHASGRSDRHLERLLRAARIRRLLCQHRLQSIDLLEQVRRSEPIAFVRVGSPHASAGRAHESRSQTPHLGTATAREPPLLK